MLRRVPENLLREAGRRWRAWYHPPRHRLRVRRRVLLFSAPVLLALLVAAAAIANMVTVGNSAVSAFANHDTATLRSDVERLRSFGVIDSGTLGLAEGDVLVLEGKLVDAQARFADALEATDPEASCPVRINLELVRETLGDLAANSGRIADADKLYNDALTVVGEAPGGCFADNADPVDERRAVLADTAARLERKIAHINTPPAQRPPPTLATVIPEPPPPTGSSGGPPGPPPPGLPPIGQADQVPGAVMGPGSELPGENLPVPPPPPPPPPPEPGGGPGPGPGDFPVADPNAPNPARILGQVGADGLPVGDPNTAGPPLSLSPGDGEPRDRLQEMLENANSYGGQRE
ncbi:hypothetical protein H7J88_19410 [Mycolicibacterium flavescens]|uniref:Uncharacterized protein n=1 Tax=Mycolicibacterium flavescens TaxID=1776 RepID=A0A1E3RLT6_MYCFV|nr:hypothetical protein [Mycolicibacterium flavescens]MCV7281801.1 hypothetical protein [Mycolicibacterium flavescens]ODQ90814.1 hypothetical protein BHQ18_08810 [Mycolicibacterium flavescens]